MITEKNGDDGEKWTDKSVKIFQHRNAFYFPKQSKIV